jgi:predicted GNAT family acetyltransferase
MEEELVQTKENAKAEAAQLNAEILSLQIMCAGLEEQHSKHGYATTLAHNLYSEFNSHILGH